MHEILDAASEGTSARNAAPAAALNKLCHDIGRAVDTEATCDLPRYVATLMPDVLAQPDLLTAEQRSAPTDCYGRNPVFICPQDKFSVLAMIWPAGISTPIHDHRDWCTLGVYEGVIEETYYSPASDAPDCVTAVEQKMVRHQPGDIAHLPVDAPNIHKIHNPTDKAAISIHVYGGNCEALGPNLDKIYTVG